MSTRKLPLALALTVAFGTGIAIAESPKLGQPITESDITAWNIEALPDGKGLPPGNGTAKQGAAIYSQKCALCHGENGVNPRPGYIPLVGPSKFDRIDTMKSVPYYKYATTLFDVMRRSMPYPIPKTLTNSRLVERSRASWNVPRISGMIMAVMTPIRTITTINSTSVNPRADL